MISDRKRDQRQRDAAHDGKEYRPGGRHGQTSAAGPRLIGGEIGGFQLGLQGGGVLVVEFGPELAAGRLLVVELVEIGQRLVMAALAGLEGPLRQRPGPKRILDIVLEPGIELRGGVLAVLAFVRSPSSAL